MNWYLVLKKYTKTLLYGFLTMYLHSYAETDL